MTDKPGFASEAEERAFYDKHDVTDEVAPDQWKKNESKRATTTTFAVRLDVDDVAKIRELAEARGIGPTQLARSWMLDRLRLEERAGELANPDADEEELQIRRKVVEDVSAQIPDLVALAIVAAGVGAYVGKKASEAKRKSTVKTASKVSGSHVKKNPSTTTSRKKAASG